MTLATAASRPGSGDEHVEPGASPGRGTSDLVVPRGRTAGDTVTEQLRLRGGTAVDEVGIVGHVAVPPVVAAEQRDHFGRGCEGATDRPSRPRRHLDHRTELGELVEQSAVLRLQPRQFRSNADVCAELLAAQVLLTGALGEVRQEAVRQPVDLIRHSVPPTGVGGPVDEQSFQPAELELLLRCPRPVRLGARRARLGRYARADRHDNRPCLRRGIRLLHYPRACPAIPSRCNPNRVSKMSQAGPPVCRSFVSAPYSVSHHDGTGGAMGACRDP